MNLTGVGFPDPDHTPYLPPFHVSLKLSLLSCEANDQIAMLGETVWEHRCHMYRLGPQPEAMADLSKHCSFPPEPQRLFLDLILSSPINYNQLLELAGKWKPHFPCCETDNT